MSEHRLKTWPEYMGAILDGRKTFEIRKNDRGFLVGDTLLLQEWDPVANSYTGVELRVRVSYITDWNQHLGYVVMAIHKE